MTYYDFEDLIGDLTPEQRARVEALKDEARAEIVTFNLKELRRHRNLTQTELARRLDRAQASVSAMEAAADNLVSTLRTAVEGMGGHLEVTAVFDDERIPLSTHTRKTHQQRGEEPEASRSAVQDAFLSAAQTAMADIARQVRTTAEKREALVRLLADVEHTFLRSEDDIVHFPVGPGAETGDADQASPKPAHST